MPQSGQWRMVGRGRDVIGLKSANSADRRLIQINNTVANWRTSRAWQRRICTNSDLRQSAGCLSRQTRSMWQEISTAPFDRDLELAVIDGDGPHALVFPCRRILSGWMNAETRERLDVRPTHWRVWNDGS
jgi:hypothetical protein